MTSKLPESLSNAGGIRQLLQHIRTQHALGQRELATLLGCPSAHLSMTESGLRQLPTEVLLCLTKVATALEEAPESCTALDNLHHKQCQHIAAQLRDNLKDLRLQVKQTNHKLQKLQARYQAARKRYALLDHLLGDAQTNSLNKGARLWAQVNLMDCEKELQHSGPRKQLALEEKLWQLKGRLRNTRKRLVELEG